MAESRTAPPGGDRLAKVIARSGLCSRRDAEGWIKDGRVTVNGKTVIRTPAFNVTDKDKIKVDGAPARRPPGHARLALSQAAPASWSPRRIPRAAPTIFETLAQHGLPRVVTDRPARHQHRGPAAAHQRWRPEARAGTARDRLAAPLPRPRLRHGHARPQLDKLKDGVEIDGIKYGPIEATLERDAGQQCLAAGGAARGQEPRGQERARRARASRSTG